MHHEERKKLKQFFTPVSIYFLIFIYVIFSWWRWWFVGFGNRAMIGTYGVLAIPFATYFKAIINKNKILVAANLLILAFLVFLNVFQTDQYKRGIIHYDGMNLNIIQALKTILCSNRLKCFYRI